MEIFEDIQDKPQHFKRTGEGSSKSTYAVVTRNEYAPRAGMEGYDYSFVDVQVTKNGKNKTIRMFSKSIDPANTNEKDGKVSPEEVLRRYADLKHLGLPVPNTLRISEDGKHILMTDMTQKGRFEIVDRHNTNSEVQIRNLEDVKSQVRECANRAKEGGYIFSPDAFAVLVDRKTGTGKIAILDIGSGIYSPEKLNEIDKKDFEISDASAEDFNFMLDLMQE